MKLHCATSLATLIVCSMGWVLPASAQTAPAAAATTVETKMDKSTAMAEGEIRKISKDIGKLTIKHGVIKSLDMPPMTMVFTAKDPAMLDAVAVGDKVRFVVVDEGGKMVVTELQKSP